MHKKLHNFQENAFDYTFYLMYTLIVISALGFSESAQKYIEQLDYYVRIYICLFLMWRFNPLRKQYEFTNLDAKIAFTAGFFILTTTALNQYIIIIKDRATIKVNDLITKYKN
jgi:cytochrome c biogenesis protein CcdA